MLCGAESLVDVAKEKIAPSAHQVSGDGKLSWEEVECLGSCSNAPMIQIDSWVKGGFHSDYYEDLTPESFGKIIEAFRKGDYPKPGPQNGRFGSEPLGGLTSLTGKADNKHNASVDLAIEEGAA